MTLITPVMALAPHTADAGPRITSICLISLRVDREEVPRDEPEEVLVDRASVQQHQHGIGERAGGGTARHVDVARRRLHGVESGHEPQQIRHALNGRPSDDLLAEDRHRGRRVQQVLLAPRGRDDDDVIDVRRVLWRGRPLDLRRQRILRGDRLAPGRAPGSPSLCVSTGFGRLM